MIFKAIIKALPQDDNKYLVRIPPLEDNTTTEFILPALLCNQPGEYANYKVDDVVFIEFENNKLNMPVIIGKLYKGIESDGLGYIKVDKLEVTGGVELPGGATIGGYSAEDFFNLYQRAENTLSNIIYYNSFYAIDPDTGELTDIQQMTIDIPE